MEGLLGKFQADLGQVSEDIRTLQVRRQIGAFRGACNLPHEVQAATAESLLILKKNGP
jgi:hypothetical protein